MYRRPKTLFVIRVSMTLFLVIAGFCTSYGQFRRPPSMNPPQDMILLRNSGEQTVTFTGINDNSFFFQTITFQGSSSDNSIIDEDNFSFVYSQGASTAQFLFTPEPDKSGQVVIQINLSDPDGSTSYSFEVFINSPPTFDLQPSHIIPENSGAQTLPGFASNISDGDDDDGSQSLVFHVELSEVVSGNLSFSTSPTLNSSGTLSYAANPDTFGEAVFIVTLDDGQKGNNLSEEHTFSIVVDEYTNVPPTFALSGDVEDDEDFTATHSVIVVPDPVPGDEQWQPVVYSLEPASVDFAEISFDPASGMVLINAVQDRFGEQTFTITADDGEPIDNTHSEEFTLTIHNVDDPPTMNDISDIFLPENPGDQQVLLTGLSAGPFETHQEIISIIATSFDQTKIPHPTVQYTSPETEGRLFFYPTPSAAGQTVIQVIAIDEDGLSTTKTFNVFVADVNDPPYFNAIPSPIVIEEDAGEQYTVISGIHAGPGESQFLTFDVTSDNPDLISNAAVTYSHPSANGILTFSPNTDANGTAVLTVTLTDDGPTGEGHQNSFSREVEVNVTPVSDAPRFVTEPDTIAVRDSLYSYAIIGADPDEGDGLTFSEGVVPSWLLLEDNGDGTALLSGTPTEADLGVHLVNIELHDDSGEVTWQEFNLHVENPNNLPHFTSDPDGVAVSGSYYSYLIAVDDHDNMELLTVSAIEKPVWLTFTDNQNRTATLEGTPPQSVTGTFPVTLRVVDPRGGQADQTFDLAVYRYDPELAEIEESVVVFPYGDESVPLTQSLKVLSRKTGMVQSAIVKFDRSTYKQGVDSIGLNKPEGISLTFDWFNGELGIQGALSAAEYETMLRSARYFRKNKLEGEFVQRKVSFVVFYEGRESNEMSRIIDFEQDFVKLEIPTGFTPNDDLTNDIWNIRNIELYPEAVVRVYARNGKKVFESVGYERKWDGQSDSGEILPAGVYFYSISLNKFDFVYRGTITLLK